MVDIAAALVMLTLFPFIFFRVQQPGAFLGNCFRVLAGKRSWVGYSSAELSKHLPPIRKGIIPPYNILSGYTPADSVKRQINNTYAQHYAPLTDITLILKNFRYLGAL